MYLLPLGPRSVASDHESRTWLTWHVLTKACPRPIAVATAFIWPRAEYSHAPSTTGPRFANIRELFSEPVYWFCEASKTIGGAI